MRLFGCRRRRHRRCKLALFTQCVVNGLVVASWLAVQMGMKVTCCWSLKIWALKMGVDIRRFGISWGWARSHMLWMVWEHEGAECLLLTHIQTWQCKVMFSRRTCAMLLLLLMTGAEEFYGAPNEENMAKCNFLWMWQHQMLLPVSLVKITTNNIISYLGGHIIPGNPNSRTCWWIRIFLDVAYMLCYCRALLLRGFLFS